MLSIKVHRSYREVVALCDSSLIGKKFEDGKKEIFVRENFFKDQEVTSQQAIIMLKDFAKEDSTFNIVGPEAVKAAIEAGIINDGEYITIQGIPIALVLL